MVASNAYKLDPAFERAVVALACSKPRFYGRIAAELDPDLLGSEPAKHAMQAVRVIAKEAGRGPSSSVVVVQRLKRWSTEGKLTLEQVKAVTMLLDAAEDAGLPTEEDMVKELAPVLSRRLRDQAVQEAITSYGKGGGLEKTLELEQRARRLGESDTSAGLILGPATFDEIRQARKLERMGTGIFELDSVLDGGLERAALGVLVGGPGDGKSMGLGHISAHGMREGLFVGYATLELPPILVLARIKANLTGLSINSLLQDDNELARAEKMIYASGLAGGFAVQEFTAYQSTLDDIFEWVDKLEEAAQRKLDMLVVDYGDKVGAKTTRGEDEKIYTAGRVVFEGLRIRGKDRHLFSWTASQATRRKDRKKLLDLDDVAESMHKVRVADLVVTLNVSSDQDEVEFFVAKRRYGKGRSRVGPLPTEFDIGRMAPISFGGI